MKLPKRIVGDAAVAVGVSVLAVFIVYWPVLMGAESIYHVDKYSVLVPFWKFTWAALSEGNWPSWTPEIRGGYPLLANGEASQLYPLTYAFLAFSEPYRALDLFTLFHLALGSVFGWLYIRTLTGSNLVGLAAGLAFALSGRMHGLTIWADAVATAAYIPLLLWAIDRRSARIMALAVFLGFVAGRGQVEMLVMMMAGSYAAFRIVEARVVEGSAAFLLTARATAFGLGAGLLLSMAHIHPALAFVSDASLGGGVDEAYWHSRALQSKHLAEVFLPGLFPDGWPEAAAYPSLMVYFGLALSPFAVAGGRDTGTRVLVAFWLTMSLCALFFATGSPGAYEITQAMPLIRSLRVPARFALITSIGALVVASSAWAIWLDRRPRWSPALVGLVIADVAIAAWVGGRTVDAIAFRTRPAAVQTIRAEPADSTGSPPRYFAQSPWVWRSDVYGRDAAWVQNRFARLAPAKNVAMNYGIRGGHGYGKPRFAWEDKPMTLALLRQLGTRLMFLERPSPEPELERVLGVPVDGHVYRVSGSLPRAQVVQSVVVAPDHHQASLMAQDVRFDPEARAVVESDLPSYPPGGPAVVRLTEDRPTHVAFEVDSPSAGYLMLFDTWSPGWSARVDGELRPVHRANGRFRLVTIPAGSSRVVFDYTTPGLHEGFALSVIGLLLLVLEGRGRAPRWRQRSEYTRGYVTAG